MPTSLWSRRRLLTTLAGAAAAPTLPSIVTLTATPAHAAGSDSGETGDVLPHTERGQVVWAYKSGGRAVREAAAAALVGSPAAVTAFLARGLPFAKAEDNRFAILTGMAQGAWPSASPPARH
ncbi:ALF repeat-containing protein [Streptomyces sp. Ac-502]|uniref:ALF repeat-containing protein n=1 Tax=Streptomyces sp. Ac-502 TaxID=3342801 RepID=UPI0038629F20